MTPFTDTLEEKNYTTPFFVLHKTLRRTTNARYGKLKYDYANFKGRNQWNSTERESISCCSLWSFRTLIKNLVVFEIFINFAWGAHVDDYGKMNTLIGNQSLHSIAHESAVIHNAIERQWLTRTRILVSLAQSISKYKLMLVQRIILYPMQISIAKSRF